MKKVLLVALLVLPIGVRTQEIVSSLTTPITFPNVTGCKVIRFTVLPSTDDITKAIIIVESAGTGSSVGQSWITQWDNTTIPTGQTLVNQLNKANFSGGNASLLNQIYQKLAARNICVGSVTGTPQ